ncbi:MAG: isoleucine--tRNA ligase [Nanoarchaeota archaeon]|nr:isoleucine--tRNA ligase [Nanoarchaeota archaeon]
MSKYVPTELEPEVINFWKNNKVYEKLKKKNSKNKRFVLHDGPPYTTGDSGPHTAWNRCVKDFVRRMKRMQGFNVWDQPGFDTHGLPIEVTMEKKLGLRNKGEIEAFGTDKFIKECKEFVKKESAEMADVFYRLGEWAEWDNIYMAVNPSFMESMWWALKKAYNKGLLYEGTKVLTWCPRCGTALAGNYEVVHKDVKENSVFVKFKVKENNEYLVVWTTTPWTLPSNMAVMVNPKLDYVRIRVDGEVWILAQGLVNAVLGLVGKNYKIIEKIKGKDLEGLAYEHAFLKEIPAQKEFKGKWIHKVILSDKYVDLSAGTGLVHCAPGCGPEDHEMGVKHGIPAFNPVNESGFFTEEAGVFAGMKARFDDKKIVEMLEQKGILILQTQIEHSYPHCERCKSPVLFRVTDQWFLKVTKFKNQMLKANKKVNWIPEWAGSKSFKNWLQCVKDWGVTRQRFWGTPFPLWICNKCEKKEFIGSVKELQKKSGKKPKDLHKDVVDKIKWACSCGGTFKRHSDIIDVWIDSSCTPFASLGYPFKNKKLFEEELSKIDFLTESKDQFRGWFYGLMAMSLVTFGKNLYDTVYLHGFMTDMKGDFLSKRKQNYLPIKETLQKYGADIFRLYMLGGSSPGIDIKFDETKMKETYRSLNVLWNLVEYVNRYVEFTGCAPKGKLNQKELSVADKWILSRINTVNKQVLKKLDKYGLNEIPVLLQNFFLEDLSRSYIKFVRDDVSLGDDKRKRTVLEVLLHVFKKLLPLLAPVCPFITEQAYQSFKPFGLKELSVHHEKLPKPDNSFINPKLEAKMVVAKKVITNLLSLREELGVTQRWPLKEAWAPHSLGELRGLVESQTNIKKILVGRPKKKMFGDKHFVNPKMDDSLLSEGYAREVQRRVQELRKKKGLKREEFIDCVVICDQQLKKFLGPWLENMIRVVGAKTFELTENKELDDYLIKEVKIKDKKVVVGIK